MGLFIKVKEKDLPCAKPGWRQILDKDIEDFHEGDDVLCYNANFGRCPVSCFDILEEVEANHFDELDYRGTYYDPTGKTWNGNGWISRDGKAYACDWMEHDDVAYYYFKKSIREMESSGWIRVNFDVPNYIGRISQAQYNKCKDLGIEIDENNVLWQ